MIKCPWEGCNTNAIIELAKLRHDHWAVKCSLGQHGQNKQVNCKIIKNECEELGEKPSETI